MLVKRKKNEEKWETLALRGVLAPRIQRVRAHHIFRSMRTPIQQYEDTNIAVCRHKYIDYTSVIGGLLVETRAARIRTHV